MVHYLIKIQRERELGDNGCGIYPLKSLRKLENIISEQLYYKLENYLWDRRVDFVSIRLSCLSEFL